MQLMVISGEDDYTGGGPQQPATLFKSKTAASLNIRQHTATLGR